MNFKPIGKWLSVRFRPPQIKSSGGLWLVSPAYSQIATIISVGEQVKDVEPGDVVMMHKHGDAMDTQSSLWYHYLVNIIDNPKFVEDFVVAPVIVTEDDVFARWDDKFGVMPTKRNIVFKEFEEPEKVNGVIRFMHHRQNRKPVGEILKTSADVKNFKIKQIVLLGKYGGVYFTDIDKEEKVLVSESEILGTLTNYKNKSKILVSEPRERFDDTLITEPLPGLK